MSFSVQQQLDYKAMLQTILSNKNQKFTETIKKKNIYVTIKRFTGGKKAASETSKLIADNMSHSPKPSIPTSVTPTNLPISSSSKPSIPRSSSPEKSFATENNSPSFNFTKRDVTSSADKIPPGLPPGKYTPFGLMEDRNQQNIPDIGIPKDISITTSTTFDPSSIPIPPPLPTKPIEKIAHIPFDLKKQLQEEYIKRLLIANQDISSLLEALHQREIIDIEEGKAKSLFYQYIQQTYTSFPRESINLSKEDFKISNINIGLLKVINVKETVILSGNQTHPILLYTLKDNKIIAWGYLTSEDDKKNIELSSHQPFSNKSTKQFLRMITPFIVQLTDIESLPEDQQAKGFAYLQDQDVQNKLKEKFIEQLIPKLKESIGVYNGSGFTSKDLSDVLSKFELEQCNKAEKLFIKYKKMKNQLDEQSVDKWLKKIQNNNKQLYPYLNRLIEQHETK